MQVRHTFLGRVGRDRGRFRCPEGHTFVEYMVGAQQRRLLRIHKSQSTYEMLASWWSKAGVTLECPVCRKELSTKKVIDS